MRDRALASGAVTEPGKPCIPEVMLLRPLPTRCSLQAASLENMRVIFNFSCSPAKPKMLHDPPAVLNICHHCHTSPSLQFLFVLGFICYLLTPSIPEIFSRVNLLHFCIQPLMHFDTLYWSLENQNKTVCGMSWGAGEILHVSAACVKTQRRGCREQRGGDRASTQMSVNPSIPNIQPHTASPGTSSQIAPSLGPTS